MPAESSEESVWDEEEEDASNLTAPRPKDPIQKLHEPLGKRHLLKKFYPQGVFSKVCRYSLGKLFCMNK